MPNATIWQNSIGEGEVSLVSDDLLTTESNLILETESSFSIALESIAIVRSSNGWGAYELLTSDIWADAGNGEPSIVSDSRVTESGLTRDTESGIQRDLEPSAVRSKSNNLWGDYGN